MFVIEFMDDVAEAVEGFCVCLLEILIKPLVIVFIEGFIILSYPAWIVPYKIFRKNGKNQRRLTPRKERKDVKSCATLRR